MSELRSSIGQPIEHGLLAQRAPHLIVDDARQLMRQHLAEPLTAALIAKAMVINKADLEGCFREVAGRSIADELYRMRLNALYEQIRARPRVSIADLTACVGLQLDEVLEQAFEDAFWITLHDHQQHSARCGAELPAWPSP